MSTQHVTHPKVQQAIMIRHETELHVRLRELLAAAPASDDSIQYPDLQHLSGLPGMNAELRRFYARALPRGCAPAGFRPFYPCP